MKNTLWKTPGFGRLIAVTIASSLLFVAQIVASHITHGLTLQATSYHTLYNIFSLAGCIATIKMCKQGSSVSNTFGWARLEVLSMVVTLLFLFALDFSLVVEAVQTIIHSGHTDAMHNPVLVCIIAGCGILLNCFCTLLIGGFTHHQGSFLALSPRGEVFIPGAATEDAVRRGLRRLASPQRPSIQGKPEIEIIEEQTMISVKVKQSKDLQPENDIRVTQRCPTVRSVIRDNASPFIAVVTAVVVFLCGEESDISLFVDPIMTILSVVILGYLSYPFILEAGQILLQTTPAHIDVGELQTKLKEAFPAIINIHDLHVWALTPDRVIATAHLVFMNEHVYLGIKDDITNFFLNVGTRVTLQPEFFKFADLTPAVSKCCILTCNGDNCKTMTCCNHQTVLRQEHTHSDPEKPHGLHRNCDAHTHCEAIPPKSCVTAQSSDPIAHTDGCRTDDSEKLMTIEKMTVIVPA